MTEYKKDKATIYFTDLQNRINLFFEYHVIELLYFS